MNDGELRRTNRALHVGLLRLRNHMTDAYMSVGKGVHASKLLSGSDSVCSVLLVVTRFCGGEWGVDYGGRGHTTAQRTTTGRD
jgi:hypothetical protein